MQMTDNYGFFAFFGNELKSDYREELIKIFTDYSCEECYECGEPIVTESITALEIEDNRINHCHQSCTREAKLTDEIHRY